jgi:excisionase family DNA binding protein
MKTMEDDTLTTELPAFMTTSDVSKALGVSPNTVTRWAREGRLACQVTLGGHHRFQRATIEELKRSLNRCASPARRGP